MAKGSGMIEPNMATMLAFVTTDAAVPQPLLHRALCEAVDDTFNAITVDGECSTNDCVMLLANGAERRQRSIRIELPTLSRSALHGPSAPGSALGIVRGGEGATKLDHGDGHRRGDRPPRRARPRKRSPTRRW